MREKKKIEQKLCQLLKITECHSRKVLRGEVSPKEERHLKADMRKINRLLGKVLKEKNKDEETAIRYALRLRYPYVHHLSSKYPHMYH